MQIIRLLTFIFRIMTREDKLEAIYQEMANKKLKLWSKCKSHNWENVIFIRKNKTWSYLSIRENEEFTVSLWYTPEIIWHPVMIWDVLDWIENKKFNVDTPIMWFWFDDGDYSDETKLFLIQKHYSEKACILWESKRLSIEEQSDECIDYVYSLIQK